MTSNAQIERLLDLYANSIVVSSQITIQAGLATVLAEANPLRICLILDAFIPPGEPEFIPMSNRASAPFHWNNLGNQTFWAEIDINKYYSLCQVEWDIIHPVGGWKMSVLEVIYGSK